MEAGLEGMRELSDTYNGVYTLHHGGLYNRYAMETRCRKSLEENGKDIDSALLMIALDGLKDVNDNYGCVKGDELLKDTADIALSHAKRLGGNRYMIYNPTLKAQTNADMLTVSRERF